MATSLTLNASKRTIFGKKVKQLRKQKLVPANVYGSDIKSEALTLKFDDFRIVFEEAGESSVVDLLIEGETKKRPVLIKDPQFDPITRQVLHVDLRQVNLKEKIKAMIDIVLTGEAPAQTQGALIITLKDQVEVEALPTDLPEQIEVDITVLENIDDTITAADLKLDRSKVELQLEDEEVIVKAEAPKEEEVEEAPAEGEEGAEGEVTAGEATTEADNAGAGGDAKEQKDGE